LPIAGTMRRELHQDSDNAASLTDLAD